MQRAGDYVTCSSGTSVCAGGVWGACTAKTRITRSLGAKVLGNGGVLPLATIGACGDPCDPTVGPDGGPYSGCVNQTDNAGDVDGSIDGSTLVNAGDGALSLFPVNCKGTECQIPTTCGTAHGTTLTGTVMDPAGLRPIANALVYIPVNAAALPALDGGPSCGACAAEQSIEAVAVTRSDADGRFTLNNVPASDVPPFAPVPLVVQTGHWRRMQPLPQVPSCAVTNLDPSETRLPSSSTDVPDGGEVDLPRIAIATGENDPFECLLLKIGISPQELQGGPGPQHVSIYHDNGLTIGGAPPGSALYGPDGGLGAYDIVVLPCEGPVDNGVANADRMAAYANGGGHVFATHYSYSWLATPSGNVAQPINPVTGNPNPFYGVAAWDLNNTQYSATVPTDIDQSTGAGQIFDTWLGNVGALSSGTLPIAAARHDVDAVNAPAQRFIYDSQSPNEPFYFSFDTPLPLAPDAGVDAGPAATPDGGPAPAAGSCGRVAFSDFHVSTADILTGPVDCSTNSDCGFGATCTPGTPGTCAPLSCATDADCAGEHCQGPVTFGKCMPMRACTTANDCQSQVCNAGTCAPPPNPCVSSTQCGNSETCAGGTAGTCGATCKTNTDCPGGELCTAGTCTGCKTGSNCLSRNCQGAIPGACSQVSSTTLPAACAQSPMTPQEKALEYMLFDLTSCQTATPEPEAPPLFSPATFQETLVSSSCAPGTHVRWRRLLWSATIPPTASIDFSAQTAGVPVDGGAVDWADAVTVPLETATSATPSGFRLLDTGDDAGAFGLLNPPDVSQDQLMLTITLNPTSDRLATPTLTSWTVIYDCVDSE